MNKPTTFKHITNTQFDRMQEKTAECLLRDFGVSGQTVSDFLSCVTEPELTGRALVRINCEAFANLDEVEDNETMSLLFADDSFLGMPIYVEPINSYSAAVYWV